MASMSFDRINIDLSARPPAVSVGNTDLTPAEIVEELDAGTSREQLIAAFPHLTAADVDQAVAFIAVMRDLSRS